MEDNKANMRARRDYFREAKIYWIIAAVFAGIAIVLKILIAVIYFLERK